MRQPQNLPHDFRSRMLSGSRQPDAAPSRDMQLWAKVEREKTHADYIVRMRMVQSQERSIQVKEMGIIVSAIVGIFTAFISAFVLIIVEVLNIGGF